MCRGWGRVERAIIAAFEADPTATFSTSELCAVAYPGIEPVDRHRVAVLRAARNTARSNWCLGIPIQRGRGGIIYLNPVSTRSYSVGMLRAEFRDRESVAAVEAMLDDPQSRYHQFAQPGGLWHLHVCQYIFRMDGQQDKAAPYPGADRPHGGPRPDVAGGSMTEPLEIKEAFHRRGEATAEVVPSRAGEISALASASAPIIFFEMSPFSGVMGGMGTITLAVHRQIGVADGSVVTDRVIVAHLKGTIEAMAHLREQITAVITMDEEIKRRQVADAFADGGDGPVWPLAN